MTNNCVLILGATSDIARETAKIYAKNGYDLVLAARNSEAAKLDVNNLRLRYKVNVKCIYFDVENYSSYAHLFSRIGDSLLGVISFVGYLGNQEISQNNFIELKRVVEVNFTGVVSVLEKAADYFEHKKNGFIVGVGSVAGDRGRKSNYIYGASKGALEIYFSGLRNRLTSSGVHVLLVKPGFVDTKMTKNIDLPPLLTSRPDEIALDIYKAQQNGKNTIYSKWFWQFIMFIIKYIPENIFKKTNI